VRTFSNWPLEALGPHIEERRELAGARWPSLELVGLSNTGRIVARRESIGPKTAPKCRVVMPGDIVFNPIRFSIGSIARYYGERPAIVSPEYVVFRTRPTCSAEFLVRYLRTPLGRSVLDTETQGSVRYRVYFRNLESLLIPLAPIGDQARAEQLLLGLRTVFHALDLIRGQLEMLDRAILAKAFRGELVPQDPNDEPASDLLARIAAERDAAPVSGTKAPARAPKRAKRAG